MILPVQHDSVSVGRTADTTFSRTVYLFWSFEEDVNEWTNVNGVYDPDMGLSYPGRTCLSSVEQLHLVILASLFPSASSLKVIWPGKSVSMICTWNILCLYHVCDTGLWLHSSWKKFYFKLVIFHATAKRVNSLMTVSPAAKFLPPVHSPLIAIWF